MRFQKLCVCVYPMGGVQCNMMRGALVFAVVLCVGAYEFVSASDEDDSYIPVVNGFMKTA